jgi:hypothetical protein
MTAAVAEATALAKILVGARAATKVCEPHALQNIALHTGYSELETQHIHSGGWGRLRPCSERRSLCLSAPTQSQRCGSQLQLPRRPPSLEGG